MGITLTNILILYFIVFCIVFIAQSISVGKKLRKNPDYTKMGANVFFTALLWPLSLTYRLVYIILVTVFYNYGRLLYSIFHKTN